ncbi:MAG: glycosyltransferase family 4 protein [Planctomycetota bacterium]|nr:MAG: glycosyltransferase family 4 protein [Planctomycetota bacterium]
MHIVIIAPFPKDADHINGGVAGATKYLADELVKKNGIQVTIVVPRSNVGETTYEKWDNYQVYRVGAKRIWFILPGTIYAVIVGRGKLNKVIRRLKPDLVHYQGCAFLASNCKVPHILTVHGIAEYDALQNWKGAIRWLRWLVLKITEDYGRRRVPHIIMLSKYAQELLKEKIRAQKTWLIENPIANSYFNVDWQFEPGRILCCSRIMPLKNILGMIKAFIHIVQRFPHSRLRLAGTPDTDYLRACKQEIESNNLQNRVRFLGNLSVKDVQFELSKANCLAIPSFQENAPLTVEEAMAVGVPVVGAKVGGIPDMVENEKTGFLVDPNDTKSICQAISKILSDETLARSMGHRAEMVAKKRFMASVICEQTLGAYNEILAKGR